MQISCTSHAYLLHISHANLRHISEKSRVYLRSKANVSNILGIYQSYLNQIAGIYSVYLRLNQANLSRFICKSLGHLSQISGPAYPRHISGTFQTNLWLIFSISQTYHWYITCMSKTLILHSISQAKLKTIQAYSRNIRDVSQAYSGIYHAYLRNLSGISQAYLCISQAYPWQISSKSKLDIW